MLRTGEVFSGKVLRANQEEVSIQLESGGILSFRANRVGRVRQQGRSVDGSDTIVYNATPEPGLEPAPLPPAPASGPGAPPLILRPGAPATPKEPGTTPKPKDLSSFPLHAQKSSAAASASPPASAPVSVNAGPTRFRDTANGYSLVLPRGFKVWDERKPANVLQGFIDPMTQANLTISLFNSAESLDRLKDEIVALLPRRTSAKVVHESRRDVAGPGGYRGWLLELENMAADTLVRQFQLLTKTGGKVYMVTYSAASKSFPAYSRSFEESIQSFRFEVPKAPEGPESNPEVQAYLRQTQNAVPTEHPGSLSDGDPRRNSVDVDRLMQKVDDRMRLAPLRPYTITP